jgi:sugar phosphate isomerase/epimerase
VLLLRGLNRREAIEEHADDMSSEIRIDRRKFLGTAAGVAGAAALGSWGAPKAFSRPGGPNGPIVTHQTLGIQHFSVRDATDRLDKTIMGYLGGPNFPEDPTDLGPLVPLPGGMPAVFEYLASVGITGFEFFNFNQTQYPTSDARRTPSLNTIKGWLDAVGMKSIGTHTGGTNLSVPTNTRSEIAIAHTLGHEMIGTAGDATNGGNTKDSWDDACETFSDFGEMLWEKEGIKLYFHPEVAYWTFFADPDHPELSRTHKIDYFAANTDPRYVNFEIDTYHMWNNRVARPDPVDGSYWDAAGFVKSHWKRIVAYHIKDANRSAPGLASQYTQTVARPGFTLNGGVDAINSLEGQLGKGYPVDPDPNVIGFRKLFTEVRANRAKGFRYHIIESDSGPGGTADQGRSLRLAKISARNLLALT